MYLCIRACTTSTNIATQTERDFAMQIMRVGAIIDKSRIMSASSENEHLGVALCVGLLDKIRGWEKVSKCIKSCWTMLTSFREGIHKCWEMLR